MERRDPSYQKKPPWLKVRLPGGKTCQKVTDLLNKSHLNTVCQEARCPNIGECFSEGIATFLIMGAVCTRNCTFCAVQHGAPGPLNEKEPFEVARAVEVLGLNHAVVTSVTRDDLPDGGASHFVRTIEAIRDRCPEVRVEVLIPDFKGSIKAIERLVEAKPDVINHNLETVPRLYKEVRPQAHYNRSLEVLRVVKELNSSIPEKSGLMLGLGEWKEEVIEVMKDLRSAGCSLLTLGQYLQPSKDHHRVVRYVPPDEFKVYQKIGESMGFAAVFSGPLVRSSYQAHILYQTVFNDTQRHVPS